MCMSGLLLASSLIYEPRRYLVCGQPGALGLAYLSFTEGREAFAKANGAEGSCHVNH